MNKPLTAKDFATDQEVRWCPGCGDYAILKCVQKTLADVEANPDKTVFVSGIGCSSRFPYYMNAYGFHTIHGRAPAFATGLKIANPELDVWLVTGDGDGLSIGGNHLLHILRRNVDVQVMLFNNEIYGLTKGQFSPTSRVGTRSPSTPGGSIDNPVNPCAFALGANARFIARGIDTDAKNLAPVLKAAREFKGAAFIEIFQNCIVYNKDRFDDFAAKKTAAETQLHVEHGKPMLFAKGAKGLKLNVQTLALEVVDVGENGVPVEDVLVHDETSPAIAQLLFNLPHEGYPMPLGVIYRNPEESFDEAFWKHHPTQGRRTAKIADALRKGSVWTKS
ncbi:2-oxoacid:ferredoxin oxidoreductase subunit beta [Hyphococcus luteus]|uniref:2-oxoacid:ferredoxin oxidoreductase subunit beta n=1 Tax=Hyphococcus luteus TaxID=2058213 RepID=A0A2S7K2Q0_9PROT|nr:2-oxoacid:ferredoxin oxidoreductase subunit beta [Marinicaulis flavus]PQA86728.1 2-oxoacid:ferredoxin oxidoreductase subunit beta [Marinicaulis flavus]